MPQPFSRKKMIFTIRLLVIITTAYFIIFTPATSRFETLGLLFIALYLFTNLVVAGLPEELFYKDKVFHSLILIDSIMLPMGIYLSGYAGSDLYLMYFLIVSLTTISTRLDYLLFNTLIFSVIYGWILYQKGLLTGPSSVYYSLRIPFIISIASFYGYLITTRLKDKDEKIKEINERFEQIVQATDVFMSIVDQEGKLLFANQKFVEVYGRDDEKSILGLPYSKFQSPKDEQDPLQHINRVYTDSSMVYYEARDRCNNRWFTNTLSPIKNPETGEVFAVCIISKDITERIQKEKELNDTVELLRRTRDQLIQKDKMAALGRMASGIAHEIRNPLEIIAMGVDYLDYNLPEDNPNVHKSIQKIYNAITRVNNIIRDILSFSRQSPFKLKNVPVASLVDKTLSLAQHTVRKNGIAIERRCEDELMEISTDYNMLEQVLLNLINNAVDAMKESSEKKLTIAVYREKVSRVDYRTGSRRSDFFKIGDKMVVIEISDTGKGIPEDIILQIFEPFFTTKPTNEGTGLGLSLSHMIMERLKGTINVESRVDQGTSFFVKLQPANENEEDSKR